MFSPEFSIITLTWNRKYTLEKFFPAMLRHTDWSTSEMIVIEQGSDEPGVRELVAQSLAEIPQFRLLQNRENVGIPRGWNLGLTLAQGKILCCIGSDVEVCEGWQEELRYLLTYPKAGCVSIPSDETFNAYLNDVEISTGDNGVRAIHAPGNTGDMLVFMRSTFAALGYFNEEYGLYGEEDSDFCIRVSLLGLKNLYSARMKTTCLSPGLTDEARMQGLEDRVRKRQFRQLQYMSGTRSLYVAREF